jgi:hypothetical protein
MKKCLIEFVESQLPPAFTKRDWLREIEKEIQKFWEESRIFEEDAPDDLSIPKVRNPTRLILPLLDVNTLILF